MTELIITEKPSAALKIATALADKSPVKKSERSVPYYELKHKGKDIIIACAVGHLYTVGEVEKTPWSKFPIFDVKWTPTYEVNKSADFSKKYLDAIKKIAKLADEFTVACDYDIEGEVIGFNIIKIACKKNDAARMKFSTLTKPDLIKAYENKSKTLDWGQANAGVTRHILDFYYGINLTRALTGAINKATGGFKVLSSGRVQGPALKIVVDREKEIKAFVPVSYWEIELNGSANKEPITGLHVEDKFWEKEKADKVMQNVNGAKEGKVKDKQKKQFKQAPPVPFDLTSLQIEAHRCFRFKPKQTLEHAQNLYSRGFISYPRTSSQKLPVAIGFKKIIQDISRQQKYTALANQVLATSLKPNEGKKTDDAHPSIYPTGIAPDESINEYEYKLYDLIVKRFLAVFGQAATRETNTIIIEVNSEDFLTKGSVTIDKGWHDLYAPYVKLDETQIPIVEVGDTIQINEINQLSKETKPPNRYTQSSILRALEKKNLGTKATRAAIIETLFNRSYVIGENNLEATELGIKTTETLQKYIPEISDEELTRSFEEQMESIRKQKKSGEQVLDKAKDVLIKLIKKFKGNEKEIGAELAESNQEAIKIATTVGKCSKCGSGELVIRNGKFGKFISCNKYPDCKTIYNVPRSGKLKPTGKVCETCGMPTIEVRLPRKGPQIYCINPDCDTKKSVDENGKVIETEDAGKKYPEEGMTCPVCKTGKMILRKSFYGEFLGCDGYPKCKTMMRIVEGKVNTTPIAPKPKKKKAKKTVKKKAVKKKTVKRKKK